MALPMLDFSVNFNTVLLMPLAGMPAIIVANTIIYNIKKNYMAIKFNLCLVILILAGMVSCKTTQSPANTAKAGMYKVTILYPNGDDKTFDMEYYEKKHMPMVAGYIGDNLKFYEIDRGIAGRTASDKVPFLAIGYFYITDIAQYNKAIAQNRDAIINDFKNYTNIQPVIQVSEIKKISNPVSH
jgi:uncharacterized protein (TIGR02118 family)